MADSLIQQVGRLLIILGATLLGLGILVLLAARVPWLGRLPGDLLIERRHVTIYLPLMTSLLLSFLLTLIFWVVGRR